MVICPWCGTHYASFQTNCTNCGGPIPYTPPSEHPAETPLPAPPPAPREISDRYVWRLFWVDGGALAGSIVALVGLVFAITGAGLTLGVITAFVGIPFLVLGMGMLIGGWWLAATRYREKLRVVKVLRSGEAVLGEVTSVEQNFSLRINGRFPWVIDYTFLAEGHELDGRVTTLSTPNPQLRPGRPVYVLHEPGAPHVNALYPHA
jgi:hypothetical protein